MQKKCFSYKKNNEDIPREISVRFVCPENGEQVPDLYDPSSPLGNIKKR